MPDRRDVESVATSQYDSADDREPDNARYLIGAVVVGAGFILAAVAFVHSLAAFIQAVSS